MAIESVGVIDSDGAEQTMRTIGGAYKTTVTITRVADTNAYGAGDCIGAATGSTAAKEFATMGPSGDYITIIGAVLEIDASALIASEAGYTLYLYDAIPASAYGDNTAWDLPSGDRDNFLGKIALGTPVDLGSTLWVETNETSLKKTVKLASSSTSLYAYLTTDAAHTPTSARVYKVTLITRRAYGA